MKTIWVVVALLVSSAYAAGDDDKLDYKFHARISKLESDVATLKSDVATLKSKAPPVATAPTPAPTTVSRIHVHSDANQGNMAAHAGMSTRRVAGAGQTIDGITVPPGYHAHLLDAPVVTAAATVAAPQYRRVTRTVCQNGVCRRVEEWVPIETAEVSTTVATTSTTFGFSAGEGSVAGRWVKGLFGNMKFKPEKGRR